MRAQPEISNSHLTTITDRDENTERTLESQREKELIGPPTLRDVNPHKKKEHSRKR